jgi:hypothetical protein
MQVCGLSTIYCCYTVDNEPVDQNIPAVWPPVATPVPSSLRNANLDCTSGDCTEHAPPPKAAQLAAIPEHAPGPRAAPPAAAAILPKQAPELPLAAGRLAGAPVPGPAIAPIGPVELVGTPGQGGSSLSSGAIGAIAGDLIGQFENQ